MYFFYSYLPYLSTPSHKRRHKIPLCQNICVLHVYHHQILFEIICSSTENMTLCCNFVLGAGGKGSRWYSLNNSGPWEKNNTTSIFPNAIPIHCTLFIYIFLYFKCGKGIPVSVLVFCNEIESGFYKNKSVYRNRKSTISLRREALLVVLQ